MHVPFKWYLVGWNCLPFPHCIKVVGNLTNVNPKQSLYLSFKYCICIAYVVEQLVKVASVETGYRDGNLAGTSIINWLPEILIYIFLPRGLFIVQ